MTLETLLEVAQTRGLKALTVWKVDGGYQANVSFDRVAWTVAIEKDAATAVSAALRAASGGAPPKQETDLFA